MKLDAEFLRLPLSRNGKNSTKTSWTQIVSRSSTEIEWFVATATHPHFSQNFIRLRR